MLIVETPKDLLQILNDLQYACVDFMNDYAETDDLERYNAIEDVSTFLSDAETSLRNIL